MSGPGPLGELVQHGDLVGGRHPGVLHQGRQGRIGHGRGQGRQVGAGTGAPLGVVPDHVEQGGRVAHGDGGVAQSWVTNSS
jgi:hypothetical protein